MDQIITQMETVQLSEKSNKQQTIKTIKTTNGFTYNNEYSLVGGDYLLTFSDAGNESFEIDPNKREVYHCQIVNGRMTKRITYKLNSNVNIEPDGKADDQHLYKLQWMGNSVRTSEEQYHFIEKSQSPYVPYCKFEHGPEFNVAEFYDNDRCFRIVLRAERDKEKRFFLIAIVINGVHLNIDNFIEYVSEKIGQMRISVVRSNLSSGTIVTVKIQYINWRREIKVIEFICNK